MSDIAGSYQERFQRAGIRRGAWDRFSRMFQAYRDGDRGVVDWDRITPPKPGDLADFGQIDTPSTRAAGERELGRTAWIVLNGGIGTSMKMDRAKSLVQVKGGKNFLDLIARHVLTLRKDLDIELPLVFMNSFATRADTLKALERYPLAAGRTPLDFEQHRFPRIREDDNMPLGDGDDPGHWAPPGHGDLFDSLWGSGALDALLDAGMRWAFVSNADNLGASPDTAILGHMAAGSIEFMLEVTPKTPADVKGGTLVWLDGRLHLLEIAQVPPANEAEFQDISRFPAFNTNNLWIDLEALKARMESGELELPLIVNRKLVDSTPVVQLESAMGAAIGTFDRAAGIVVPRTRFAPVKTTDDLLVRRSDVYVEGSASPLEQAPGRDPALGPPVVSLDKEFYRSVADLELRIPHAPSLLEAASLTVKGDVRFAQGIKVVGEAELYNADAAPLEIPRDSVVGGSA